VSILFVQNQFVSLWAGILYTFYLIKKRLPVRLVYNYSKINIALLF
jgi:hypothetical protein